MLLSEPSTDCNPLDGWGTHTFNLQDLNLKGMYFAATMQLQKFMEDLTNKWNYQNYTVPFYLHNWQIMPGCVLYYVSCVMGHQSCTSPKYSCHNNYKLFALYTSWCSLLYIYIYIYIYIYMSSKMCLKLCQLVLLVYVHDNTWNYITVQ